jgi:hypothetical protein
LLDQREYAEAVHAVAVVGARGNMGSGGDGHEIVGPLLRLKAPELLMFARMSGGRFKAMRGGPQPSVAAIASAGASAIGRGGTLRRLGPPRRSA